MYTCCVIGFVRSCRISWLKATELLFYQTATRLYSPRHVLLLGCIASGHSDHYYTRSSVVCLSVCLSVFTFVSPAKTAEPIEMPFGMMTRVGSGNHVLDGGPDAPRGRGTFWGCLPHWKALGAFAVVYAKTAEPIEALLGGWIMPAQWSIY